jgi:hypothetical protein
MNNTQNMKFVFGLIFLLLFKYLGGQDNFFYAERQFFPQRIFSEDIKTLLIHKSGNQLAPPVINFRTNESISMSFDQLSDDVNYYKYTIIHCNSDWTPSDVDQTYYMDNYFYGEIDSYSYSFNTQVDYIHYDLNLPNDEVSFTRPGNYAIVVYQNNVNEPVLIARFFVVDKRIDVSADVSVPPGGSLTAGQHIMFDVKIADYRLQNPLQYLTASLYQNFRYDNAMHQIKPTNIGFDKISFDHDNLVFPAGREFRNFDVKDFDYQSENIAGISYNAPYHQIFLRKDQLDPFSPFFTDRDLNGKRYIKSDDAENSSTDADYCQVHFFVPYDRPFTKGSIFITGEFSNWLPSERFRMTYNMVTRNYEATIKLKQGYYNYTYIYYEEDAPKYGFLDGNFFETENDYFIFVYEENLQLGIDEIIGYKVVNSSTK